MSRTLRTALVGCGKVGNTHAQALQSLAQSEFVAVCDADPQRATQYAQRYGVQAFTSPAEMFTAANRSAAPSGSVSLAGTLIWIGVLTVTLAVSSTASGASFTGVMLSDTVAVPDTCVPTVTV